MDSNEEKDLKGPQELERTNGIQAKEVSLESTMSELSKTDCIVECSVVTGFEESARGEAKEKFGAEVKAARGKITWKMPIDQVNDVIKLGSIDNARVVLHSVSHFKFTDEHDSLARIQQLVTDFDWETGLKVWDRFRKFPHPVAPRPEKIPSKEDLIDVVLVKKILPPADKADKKKKGCRGKKKEGRKKDKKNKAGKDNNVSEDSEVKEESEINSNNSKENKEKEESSENVNSNNVAELPNAGEKTVLPSPKVKVIRKADPNRPEPEITIKVIEEPNVFPLENESGECCDPRLEQSMEVDQSFSVASSNKDKEGQSPKAELSSQISNFASSVIERLSSPFAAPKEVSTIQKDETCATPPSTPEREIRKQGLSTPSEVEENQQKQSTSESADDEGSSVDPPTSKVEPVCASTGESDVKVSEVVRGYNPSSPEKSPVKRERDPTKPTFRVTCNRVGEGHAFDSGSAAASLGSAVITYHGWAVDLKKHDIEILLNIDNEEVTVSIALTKTSLHNRNMVAFGPTTLRSTIAYNMLRLCRIKNGDFICDPMCGTSAIPIESSINWTNCYHMGGDFHEKALERSLININHLQQKYAEEKRGSLKIDTLQWNIYNFPLRDQSVDVFISDLPFGHRMGSRATNRSLYPALLWEMARCGRPGARACLLTEDRTSLIKAIQSVSKLWQRRLCLSVNIGGLSGCVFLLTRTPAAADTPPARQSAQTPAKPAAAKAAATEEEGKSESGDNGKAPKPEAEPSNALPESSPQVEESSPISSPVSSTAVSNPPDVVPSVDIDSVAIKPDQTPDLASDVQNNDISDDKLASVMSQDDIADDKTKDSCKISSPRPENNSVKEEDVAENKNNEQNCTVPDVDNKFDTDSQSAVTASDDDKKDDNDPSESQEKENGEPNQDESSSGKKSNGN